MDPLLSSVVFSLSFYFLNFGKIFICSLIIEIQVDATIVSNNAILVLCCCIVCGIWTFWYKNEP